MNVLIVTSANLGCYGWLYQEHLKQRKSLFVDRHNWDVPHNHDVELDQYDRPDTVYVLAEDCGKLIGYARLLPTQSAVTLGTTHFTYMVKDATDGLLPGIPDDILWNDSAPVSPNIWEMTRFHARDRATMNVIFQRAAEYLVSIGVTQTVSFTRTAYKNVLSQIGLKTRRLGHAVTYADQKSYCVLETDLTQCIVDHSGSSAPTSIR